MDDPITGYLRVKAVCVFTNHGRILVNEGYDKADGQRFLVPIGGRVEFGESTEQAITREVAEELSAEVTDVALMGVLENQFTLEGGAGHEIVFVYDARFVDRSIYAKDSLPGIEGETPFTAQWLDPWKLDDPLYPDGLLDLISSALGTP